MKRIVFLAFAVCLLSFSSCMMKEFDDDYYFRAGGVEIAPGERAEDVLGYLGEHRSMQSSPSCAFEGEERVYKYSGYDIYTFYENGREIVERVVITSDSVSTERGVRIGDSRHDVVEVYGRDYDKNGENIEYDGERCRLQFIFRDGVVVSIKYLADD